MSIITCCFDAETKLLDTVVEKCTNAGCCCGCCAALRPRYKRLVDNIFPPLPHDGLVKSNMDKLMYYAFTSPEKLDRIGEYLYQKAGRDIYRRRYKFAIMAMDAMDQLLIACHAHTLDLFVESFLKMVQKLLESTEPELQIMATQSFVRFANIEEDTPSYHLRYDFFVSKFSSMCHNNDDNIETRDKLRLAGIKGLQGVVRKTESDDLVEKIWDSVNMDKIVPSLLYNMQTASETKRADTSNDDDNTPPLLAELCLRELVGRASFGNIRNVLRPVLRHVDNHQLWLPNTFAIETFTLIMYSVQTQYSYTVVETLMSHLDQNSNPKIRTSIADTLSKIIAIAANESVGPSVLEIINSLLNHLRTSVSSPGRSRGMQDNISPDEKLYQNALINALGEFTNHLPDYQKIEIMMFILGKVRFPNRADFDSSELLLENILLKSLLKVSTKYKTIRFNTTFPTTFLEPLLQMSLAPDSETRIIVQNIFHTLIDRHGNLPQLIKPMTSLEGLGLRVGKCSRSDMIFIRKHGPEIFTSIFEGLELLNNTVENFENVFTTIALLTIELVSEETMFDVIRLLLSIQDMTVMSTTLSASQKACLHSIVISVFVIIPWVVPISSLQDYIDTVIASRRATCSWLLPPLQSNVTPSASTPDDSCLLQLDTIISCLQHSGHDVQRMLQAPGYVGLTHRHSWVDSGLNATTTMVQETTDIDSVTSSPGIQKKQIEEPLTFDSIKKILTETAESRKAIEDERRNRINELFQTATFQELLQRNLRQREDILGTKLNEVFSKIAKRENVQSPIEVRKTPAYELNFPELFMC